MKTLLKNNPKLVVTLLGFVTVVATVAMNKLGFKIPDDKVAEAVGLLATFVFGQSVHDAMTDHGASAAQIKSDGPPAVTGPQAVAVAQALPPVTVLK